MAVVSSHIRHPPHRSERRLAAVSPPYDELPNPTFTNSVKPVPSRIRSLRTWKYALFGFILRTEKNGGPVMVSQILRYIRCGWNCDAQDKNFPLVRPVTADGSHILARSSQRRLCLWTLRCSAYSFPKSTDRTVFRSVLHSETDVRMLTLFPILFTVIPCPNLSY